MNELDLMSPSKVAAQYGGDKRKIQQAAQMGLIDPTVAVMAGMFIDRMRGAAAKEQQPQTTVAQDIMAPRGVMAAQAAPIQGGVDALPVSEDMVPSEYAGGGVVAFAGLGESLVQDIIEKETREIEQGLRPDYSIEAKQAMQQRSDKLAQENKNYFAGEQNKMLSQGKDIGAMYRPSGIAALAPAPVPVPAPISAPVPEGAPMTGADLRKADRAEMALRSAPGLTPAQSEERIAAARPQVAPIKEAAAGAGMAKPQGMSEAEFRAMQKRFGVEEDAFKADREAIKDARSRLAEDRKSAVNMALIEAGLGIASGSSRSALKNIAEGSKSGVASYSKAMRDIKADEKEFDKIDRDLRKAEQALKRGDMEAFNNLQDKAEQRRIQLMGAEAQVRQAAKPSSTGELIDVLSGGSRDPQVRQAAAMKVLGQGKTGEVTEADIYKGWNDAQGNPIIMNNLAKQGIKTYDQYRAYQMSMLGGGAGIPGVKFLGVK